MKEKINAILAEIHPEHDFSASSDFIEDGLLDSFDIVTLITELEEAFSISVDGEDIVPENFATVDAIAELVNKSEKI